MHKHGYLGEVSKLLIPVTKSGGTRMLPEVNDANPLDPEHLGGVINHLSESD
jgi:hypothetical protein